MRIGIDIGGTKIEAAVLRPDGGIAIRKRVATPGQDYGAVIQAIRDLVLEVEREIGGQASIGISMPGTLSAATGLVKNSNSTCLNGRPFDRDLSAALGRSLRFANDANCFVLSEATDGAGKGLDTVFGVILGTGVGGGIAVHGRILTGPNGIAGEWGHNPLPWSRDAERPGPLCYCGKQGCIESFLSGPSLARDHREQTGEEFDANQIAERAAQGDKISEATMQRYEERLARALASAINLLDPDVIVLGGGVGRIERLYRNPPKLWGRYVFSDTVTTRLLPPQWGDSSGVRGAAWLWPEGEKR
ncbi:MAG: ROK family protein [Stellaceae bacterium]|jgi:fructokinase